MKRRSSFGLPCVLHQEQLITNFCMDEDCLLPLCPKCIKSHASEHQTTGTPLDIQSIDLALRSARQNNLNKRRSYTKVGEELAEIQADFTKMVQLIREQVKDAKARLLSEVVRAMDRLQKNILTELESLAQKKKFKLVEIDEKLRELIGNTIRVQDELNGPRCLKRLILTHSQGDAEEESTYEALQQNVQILVGQKVCLKVSEQNLQSLKGLLQTYFQLAPVKLGAEKTKSKERGGQPPVQQQVNQYTQPSFAPGQQPTLNYGGNINYQGARPL